MHAVFAHMFVHRIFSVPIFAVVIFGCLSSCRQEDANVDKQEKHPAKAESTNSQLSRNDQTSSSTEERMHALLSKDAIEWNRVREELTKMLEQDEEATWRFLAQLKTKGDTSAIADIFFEHYYNSKRWEEGLKAFAIIDENASLSAPLLARFVEAAAIDDYQKAATWLQANPDFKGSANAATTLGKIAAMNRDLVINFTSWEKAKLPESITSNYLNGLTQQWLEQAPDEALTFLSQRNNGPLLDKTIYEFTGRFGKENAAAIMPWAELIHDSGLQRSAVITTAQAWHTQNAEAYQAWKQSSPLAAELGAELP